MQQVYKIFVYGSLRSGFKSLAYNYISKYFTLVNNAKVQGLLYNVNGTPIAKPTTENKFIVGELYQVNNMDEFGFAMAQIDDYEGLNVEEGEMALYRREKVSVYQENLDNTTAWIYWFNGEVANAPIIESGDVLQFIIDKQNGL